MGKININSENFEKEVMESEMPVLVDFSARWCGPCQAISPILDEISDEQKGILKVCAVDTDECPELAKRFGIKNLPTVVLFRNGKTEKSRTGLCSKSELLSLFS